MNAKPLLDIVIAEGKDLLWWQVALRTILIYAAAVAMVRMGKQRLFGKNTAFDVIIGVVLGSVIGRGINGSATLASTLAAGAVIIFLHAFSAKLALVSPGFGKAVKGEPHLLIKDGRTIPEALAKSDISEHDIQESARLSSIEPDVSRFSEGWLERNGQISLLTKKEPPKAVEIRVEDGVQVVRIELQS